MAEQNDAMAGKTGLPEKYFTTTTSRQGRCLLLVMLISLLFSSSLTGQPQQVIDSLKQKLGDTLLLHQNQDNGKELVRTAIRLSDYYSRIRFDSAKKYATLAYRIAKKTGYKTGEAMALNELGMSYSLAGYFDRAAPYVDSALSMFEKLHDTTGIVVVKNNLAVVYMRRGAYEKALRLFQNNLKIAQRKQNLQNMLLLYNNMGIAYFDWKKYDDALDNYQKALKVLDALGEEDRKGSVLNNMGEVFLAKGEPDKARQYFQQSLKINKKHGKKRSLLISISSLGESYYQSGQYQKALQNYNTALKLSREIPDYVNGALMHIKVGETLNKLGKLQEAQKQLAAGMEMARKLKAKKILLEGYKAQMENARQQQKTEKLYALLQKYIALKDSIFNDKSLKTINELNTRFKTAQKEKQIAILKEAEKAGELEIQKQRNQKYFFIIALLLILFAASLLFNQYRIRQLKIKTKLEKERLSIEQRLLRSQINPHFIFNALNSIGSFISTSQPDEAREYLAKFARLMRLILENTRKQTIPLADEIQTLQLNLELEKLRFENGFDFEISVQEEMDPENTYIAPMLIQPFVENAVKHGLQNKKEKGRLTIRFYKQNRLLVCEVEDNGIGRNRSETFKQKGHVSLGTQVTAERFSAIKSTSENAGFHIIDLTDEQGNPAGTRVIIKIPFEEE